MLLLTPHPDRRPGIALAIEVSLAWHGPALELGFRLSGAIDRLALPPPATPARRDGLWRHTCFEIFARGRGDAYSEVNLAPSGEWAAYAFDGYRDGMRLLDIDAPRIRLDRDAGALTLAAGLRPPERPLAIGLSAVVEERDGRISYWALAHPPGAPDFHHRDCFALKLPPAD